MLDAHEIDVRASLGISMAPADTDNAETLIKNADLALYRAKDEGRNKFQFYTAEMNTMLVEHLRLVQDLRHAVEHREFKLHFQPQVHLATGELVGFEALLRWEHAMRGAMPPQSFLRVAEENDLIIPLGRWILNEACQQMGELCRRQLVSRRAVMAVNLSIHQLHDPDFTAYISDCLARSQLRPAQLELEITESVLMENLQNALHQLQEIKALGVSLSIDDFGTGYSSLGYLKRLPVNVIKVDRSFVADIPHERDDMEITSAVIAMAHKLHYKVVAEGIETSAQYQFLRDSDCDFGQGYFISHPLPPAELATFCEEYQQRLEDELIARK
jgi:EAL domain-containing protein (putative c-di-GMP-specific phosphodiesterase class I)